MCVLQSTRSSADLISHHSAQRTAVLRAVAPFKEEEAPEKPTIDDANRTFRTRLVVIWLATNAGLCIAIGRLPAVHRTLVSFGPERRFEARPAYE